MKFLKALLLLMFSSFLLVLGVSLGVVLQMQTEKEPSYEDIVVSVSKEVSPSVVSVIASRDVSFGETERRLETGGGSGFIISEDGFILTNRHVVRDEKAEYMVFTDDGRSFDAQIIAFDPVYDLAVLKIEENGLSVVNLGDSDSLKVGQTAIAIGNALGELRNTVTLGIVSGLGRDVFATDGRKVVRLDNVIQTDAGINRGNSGGPLLNLKGEVVGINTAMAIDAQNIGFAIPINDAKRAIKGAVENGDIVYPFLGVRYVIVNENIERERNLSASYGALIVRGGPGEFAIEPESAADKAGLKEGDVILKVNGVRVSEKNPLARVILNYNPDDKVTLIIYRENENISVDVVLGERRY